MAAKSKTATTKAKPKTAAEPEIIAAEPASVEIVESIKGFDANWTCRGYKFELGQTYHVDGVIRACENGFHACPLDGHPLSVFEYYPPAGTRFATVEQSGKSDKDGNKLASATITIKAEISLGELTKRAIDWVFARAKWSDGPVATQDRGAASSTGDYGAASSTGDRGAASSTGDRGAASSAGNYGAASSTGDCGVASSTGFRGAASSTGFHGAASSAGNYGAASSTGDRGVASSTGFRGAASSTGFHGAASSTGDRGAASSTGDCGAASSAGNYGAASSTGDCGVASSTGFRGAASSTGFHGAASSAGNYGAASSTGDRGVASSTGFRGAASSTGFHGAASSTGKKGAAFTCGYGGRVMGADGCTLHADERDDEGNAISVACGIVGRDGIKENIWYHAKSGKLVEVED